MIRAIFFDIDGTLTDFNTHVIPDEVFPALSALQEKGIRLFIATGRGKDGLSVLRGFPFDGFVTLNGQYCFLSDGTVISSNTVPREAVQILLAELEQDPVPCGFQFEEERLFNFRNELVDEIHAITQNDDAPAGDVSLAANRDVYQCMIFVNEDREKELLKKLPGCRGARWYPTFFDLSPADGTKVKGIDRMLDYFGISLEETMAFGDGGNDLEMIEHVPYGIAMANAGEAVKCAASYVTGLSGDGGIIQALKHYDLI